MDAYLEGLVWRGIEEANPWWRGGGVPRERTHPFRRDAFPIVFDAFLATERGRGIVVLGPRRVGKTVLAHQIVERLLEEGLPATDIVLLSLDDVALRDRDLGELLALVEARLPAHPARVRRLVLDEIQHAPDWSGWLKRIADRRDPWAFFATGSSATALARGGQDEGLGRWREMTLYPWSFREHVRLRGLRSWHFELVDRFDDALREGGDVVAASSAALAELGQTPPAGEDTRLEAALADYLVRGGFPEAAGTEDLGEARRRLRQDILDRALGRDIVDVVDADPRTLERMFLRIIMAPGGLWNESGVASDLGCSRPTVARYLSILEKGFLALRLPNLGSPVKGQSKVHLVAPALRPALLGLGRDDVLAPSEWGPLVENAVVATAVGHNPDAFGIGFFRRGDHECDVVVEKPGGASSYVEVKRSGRKTERGIREAARAIASRGDGYVLTHRSPLRVAPVADPSSPLGHIVEMPAGCWLYSDRHGAGGTLRIRGIAG